MNVPPPALSAHSVLRPVLSACANPGGIQKCLVFAPDAIGDHLYQFDLSMFEPVINVAPIENLLQSSLPPVTPVCFASMFTGASPAVHGIRSYERHLLTCDTLFDALCRAGKRVAIIAVAGCSIDILFRNRKLDYFAESYDQEVTARVLDLISTDRYDFILAYHQAYDDALHHSTPFDPGAIQAAKDAIAAFSKMAAAIAKHWATSSYAVVFAPDHGAHVHPTTNRGHHGDDIAEDMIVRHYYGVYNL